MSKKNNKTPSPASGLILYGRHAVLAALANPARKKGKILCTGENADELRKHCLEHNVSPDLLNIVDRKEIDRILPREAVLVGTEGRIVVEEMHRPQCARLERVGEKPVELEAPYPVDDLYAEIEHFVGLLLAGKTESPVMSLATSLRCAELLAAVRKQSTGNVWRKKH